MIEDNREIIGRLSGTCSCTIQGAYSGERRLKPAAPMEVEPKNLDKI